MTEAETSIGASRWAFMALACGGAILVLAGAGLILGAFEGPRGLYYCGGLQCADARAADAIGAAGLVIGFGTIWFAAKGVGKSLWARFGILVVLWSLAFFFLAFALGGPNGNLLICIGDSECEDAAAVRGMAGLLAATPGLAFLFGLRGWRHA